MLKDSLFVAENTTNMPPHMCRFPSRMNSRGVLHGAKPSFINWRARSRKATQQSLLVAQRRGIDPHQSNSLRSASFIVTAPKVEMPLRFGILRTPYENCAEASVVYAEARGPRCFPQPPASALPALAPV